MVLEDPSSLGKLNHSSTRDDWAIGEKVSGMGTNIWLVLCALSSQEYGLL